VFVNGVPQEVWPFFSLLIVDLRQSTSHAQSVRPARQRTTPEYLHASIRGTSTVRHLHEPPVAGADTRNSLLSRTRSLCVRHFKLINVTRTTSPPLYSYELLTGTQDFHPAPRGVVISVIIAEPRGVACLPACLQDRYMRQHTFYP